MHGAARWHGFHLWPLLLLPCIVLVISHRNVPNVPVPGGTKDQAVWNNTTSSTSTSAGSSRTTTSTNAVTAVFQLQCSRQFPHSPLVLYGWDQHRVLLQREKVYTRCGIRIKYMIAYSRGKVLGELGGGAEEAETGVDFFTGCIFHRHLHKAAKNSPPSSPCHTLSLRG